MQNRRDFLKIGAALAAGTFLLGGCKNTEILPAQTSNQDKEPGKPKEVNLAFFGLGGMGLLDLKSFLGVKNINVVALCDPDTRALERGKKIVLEAGRDCPKLFTDYREAFNKADSEIHAAIVATPDHTHFTIAMEAVARGKHIFVEKPICRTIDQVNRLAAAVKSAGIVSQAGNQGAISQHIRSAKEWIEAGILGEIKEIHAWTNRPVWQQGMKCPAREDPCPKELDWNLWLGPAKERPYSKAIAPFAWRGWHEYGTGALGDMAQHILNPAYFIFELGEPERIEAECIGGTELAFPRSSKITYHFPKTKNRDAIKIVWFDGKLKPPRPQGLPEEIVFPKGIGGSIIYGTKNTMLLGSSGESIFLLKDFDKIRENPPPKKYPRVRGNIYRNWIEAIQHGNTPVSDFSYSAPLTRIVLLGVIAQRLGRELHWNPQKNEFINDAEATRLLKTEYTREGFLA